MDKEKLIEDCLNLFEKSACKQTYDLKSGVTAVVEHLLKQGQSIPIDSVSKNFYCADPDQTGSCFDSGFSQCEECKNNVR